MPARLAVIALLLTTAAVQSEEPVSFPTQDGALMHALLYGRGDHGIVLAHGGRWTKESWRDQAEALAKAGFRVLAFDFRKEDSRASEGARHLDVLAAIQHLKSAGAKRVSVVGASMGGDYAAEACEAKPDAIDRLILLAAGAYTPLKTCRARKLFIMTRGDIIGDNQPRMPAIRRQYEAATAPKQFVELEGSAHAQAIFTSAEARRLMAELLRFLQAP